LDSSVPSIGRSWLERARPYLSLISIMSGPAWTQDGALLAHQDLEVVARVFAACQDVVAAPAATEHDLVESVQAALGAHEAYLLTGIPDLRGGAPAGADPEGIAVPDLADPDTVARLASSLHMTTSTVAGAVGREDPLEILLAGWASGPVPSPAALGVIARATSTARLALVGRSGAVEELVERQRTEMAYALHDGLLQTVTGAILELEGLQARIREDPGEAVRTLDLSKSEIRRALQELRGILFRVSAGPVARRTSNAEAFEASIRDAMARWRMPARLSVEGDLREVPERALSAAYVTVQEALANAAKHSGSPSVSVHVEVGDGRLRVAVADRGHGFTPREEARARAERHLGLDMLRTRVREAGGTLAIESQPGRGTRIVATLPTVEEES
jgi:signal transduction histidine kinase